MINNRDSSIIPLCLATRNRGKQRELQALLADSDRIEVVTLDDFPDCPEVVEDGDTFQANALKKALAVHEHTGILTLADDSGLEVDALNGEPGIYSARYAAPVASDQAIANNQKLLDKMKGIQDDLRDARFICAMVLCCHGQVVAQSKGTIKGLIAQEEMGSGGFGYDPLFFLPRYQKTFAELPPEVKNRISHRGKALEQIKVAILRVVDRTGV